MNRETRLIAAALGGLLWATTAAAQTAPIKSAVVIELSNELIPSSTAATQDKLAPADALATSFCQSINYSAGKALQVSERRPTPASLGIPATTTWRRSVPRLVCYM